VKHLLSLLIFCTPASYAKASALRQDLICQAAQTVTPVNGTGVPTDNSPSRSFHLWLDPGTSTGGYQGYFLIREAPPAPLWVFEDDYELSAHGSFAGRPVTEIVNVNRWTGDFYAVLFDQGKTVLSEELGACRSGARLLF
jgi:hypothetical protein